MHKKLFVSMALAAVCMVTPMTAKAADVYDVWEDSDFKSYMDYRCIKAKDTNQWKLQRMCTTTDLGLRTYNGRYCIALGTGFNAPAGTYVDVVLENGNVLQCIVGDIKANKDTNSSNRQHLTDGSIVEFLAHSPTIWYYTNNMGTVGYIDYFSGDVEEIIVYSEEDMADMEWEFVVEDMENTTRALVTDKYQIEVDGSPMYFIEYADTEGCSTIQVDEDTYYSKTINYSVIDVTN